MNTSAVILAAGRGARMGGVAKGLLPWQGRPLIAHLIDHLTPQVDALLLNVPRELDAATHAAYAAFGLPLLHDDPRFAGCGPLAGLHAALGHVANAQATGGQVVSVPCDLPSLPSDLVARLQHAAWVQAAQPRLAYVTSGGRAWPTLALLHTDWHTALEQSLLDGHLAAWRWFEEHGAAKAEVAADTLLNLNSSADWQQTTKGDPEKPSRAGGVQGAPQRVPETYQSDRRGASEDVTQQSARAVGFSRCPKIR